MRRTIICKVLLLATASILSGTTAQASTPAEQLHDGRLWGRNGANGERASLLRAIDLNLRVLRSRRGRAYYRRPFLNRRVTHSRILASLQRFRQLLKYSSSQNAFYASLAREFEFVPIHHPERAVHFTAYYTPEYSASRKRTNRYRYPLFALPKNFNRWPRPHQTRERLEGRSGLQISSLLRGREIAFLPSRMDAFLAHVQGSVRLRFPDGKTMQLGYAGATGHSYTSIGRELVSDQKLSWNELTLPAVREYFRDHPHELNDYLPRNKRFVFFRRTSGPARGALGTPLVAERSIATDKSIFPPGALYLASIRFENPSAQSVWNANSVTRFLLDADVGSAIKGPGRVDLYMGVGRGAEERAGVVNSNAEMYLLLLKS